MIRSYSYSIGIMIVLCGCGSDGNWRGRRSTYDTVAEHESQKMGATKHQGTVTDQDGNSYTTIKIGRQVWMAQNLKVTHYNNGDTIPCITADAQWREQTTGAWCNYDNDAKNTDAYGRLYNWHAVADKRKLAPKGWHIPTDADWQTLITTLEGSAIAGSKLKANGEQYWQAPNNTATNETGFTALPGGSRNNNGIYDNLGYSATWWSCTTAAGVDFASTYNMVSGSMGIMLDTDDRISGMSVRCIKDE